MSPFNATSQARRSHQAFLEACLRFDVEETEKEGARVPPPAERKAWDDWRDHRGPRPDGKDEGAIR